MGQAILCAHCLHPIGRWHDFRRLVRWCNPPRPPWLDELRARLRALEK